MVLQNQMMAQSISLSFVIRVGVEAEVLQCADFLLRLFSLLQSMSDTAEKHERHTCRLTQIVLQNVPSQQENC